MIYCVSDIHGDLDKLERMMELIRFSDADHLYIIGDVIDRGEKKKEKSRNPCGYGTFLWSE